MGTSFNPAESSLKLVQVPLPREALLTPCRFASAHVLRECTSQVDGKVAHLHAPIFSVLRCLHHLRQLEARGTWRCCGISSSPSLGIDLPRMPCLNYRLDDGLQGPADLQDSRERILSVQ